MILFEGKLLTDDKQDAVLEQLWNTCIATLSNRKWIAEQVVEACGRVAQKIRRGEYQQILEPLLASGVFTSAQLEEAVSFFDREILRLKYQTELGILQDAIPRPRQVSRPACQFY